jgi:Sulfatase-modifying factor enzyme 1
MARFSAPLTLTEYQAQLITVSSDNGSEFRIGRVPVTVGMWEEFCEATRFPIPWSMKINGGMVHKKRFVVGVSWEDAQKYLQWAGMMLPTTQQWELAVNTFHIGSGIYEWCQDELDEATAAQLEAEWEAFLEEYPQDVFMRDDDPLKEEFELHKVAEEIASQTEAECTESLTVVQRATRGPDWRTKRSPFYSPTQRQYDLGFRAVSN